MKAVAMERGNHLMDGSYTLDFISIWLEFMRQHIGVYQPQL
jgi:hypothetical protein